MATEEEQSSKTKRLMRIIGEALKTSLNITTIERTLRKVEFAVAANDIAGTRTALLQVLVPASRQAAIFSVIGPLYTSVYSSDAHRLIRLRDLLHTYSEAVDALQVGVATNLQGHADSVAIASALECFKNQLKETHQRVIKERDEGGDEVVDVVANILNNSTASALNEQTPFPLCLEQRGRFQWKKDIPPLSGKKELREEDLRTLTYETLDGNFKRLPTARQSLFASVVIDDEEHHYHEFDAINAVWLSPSFSCVVDGIRDEGGYRRLLDVVMEVPEPSKRDKYRCTPLDLATAMSRLSVDIGVVFSEQPEYIIWPLGSDTGNAHTVIVLCERKCRGWRYSAAELHPNARLLSKPRVPTFEELLKRDKSSVQADSQGVANRSVCGWKPFPFLRLPAELRLRVYEAYFDEKKYFERRSIYTLQLPELAKTCRQIRDEALPVFISASRLEAAVWSGRWYTDARLLCPEKTWMALPGVANIRSLQFDMRRTRGYSLFLLPLGQGYVMTKLQNAVWPGGQRAKNQIWAFEELVRMIVEDRTTPGLSMSDVAATLCFAHEFLIY